MHQATVLSGLDTFIFGAPLIALLFFGYFRLDESFTSRKVPVSRPRPIPAGVEECSTMLTDPDGRPWTSHPRKN
jgi:hypothetical protein